MRKLLPAFLLCCFAVLGAFTASAQNPVANFTATPLIGCAPLVSHYTDASTGTSIVSREWTFPGGSPATLPGNSNITNPTVVYLTSGTYSATLVVTDASGHTSTKTITNYITVTAPPTISFYSPDTVAGCAPFTAHFVNQTVLNAPGAGTYQWDFGDGDTTGSGLTNPVHIYQACGTYSVTLIVTNSTGCSQIFTKSVYIKVNPKPIPNFVSTNNNTCTAPSIVNFDGSSSTGGGCGTTVSSYAWTFLPALGTATGVTASQSYNAAGNYDVKLTVTNSVGCSATIQKDSFVNIGNLNSSFTVSQASACTGNPDTLTNTTTPSAGTSIWYYNGFGSVADNNQSNPNYHTFSTPGIYQVKLVTQFSGCSDTASATVTVVQGPTPAFTASPTSACTAPLNVTFNAAATTGATSYTWTYGDPTAPFTTTANTTSHNYTANGVFDVTLVAHNAACAVTLIKPGFIRIQQPTATIGGASALGCAPTPNLSFPVTISPAGTYQLTYNFGDGSAVVNVSSTAPVPTHSYTNAGCYTITVTGTGSGTYSGCSFTATKVVCTGSVPTVAFTATPSPVCYGTPTVIVNNSTPGATTYSWNFGDGTNYTGQNPPPHVFGNIGNDTVHLVVTTNGCAAGSTAIVVVSGPKPSFSYSVNCASRKCAIFTNSSVTAGTMFYHWDFGVAALATDTANTFNASYCYPANGSYTVKLKDSSSNGCVSTTSLPIAIFDILPAFTSPDTAVCVGTTVHFTITNGTSANYQKYFWNFGDGNGYDSSFNAVSIGHTYAAPGTYTVTLKIRDIYGCYDSLTLVNYIRVKGINTIGFTATPITGCVPLTVTFQDTSTVINTTISQLVWNFGDAGTATTTVNAANVNNPITHTYTAKDTLDVKLVVITAAGCAKAITVPALIKIGGPTAGFNAGNSYKGCLNAPVSFTSTTVAPAGLAASNYTIYNPNGTVLITFNTANFNYTFTTAGTHVVRLIATDSTGCKDTISHSILISNIDAGFTVSDSVGNCPPFVVNFTNTSVTDSFGTTSYAWTFLPSTTTASSTNPTTTFFLPGTYTAKVVETTAYGCKDSATHSITVATGPVATIAYSPLTGCAPLTVNFSLTGISSTSSIFFAFGDGGTNTTAINTGTTTLNLSHIYNVGGKLVPIFFLSNGSTGCQSVITGSDTIRIGKPKAGFYALSDSVCQNTPLGFVDTSSSNGVTINSAVWTFTGGGVGTLSSTASTITHTFPTAGLQTIKLVVGTGSNCADSIFHTVYVKPQPTVDAGPAQTICSGNTAQLQATGATSYIWTPSGSGLSSYTIANPVASPGGTITYTVVGTDATTTCSDTDAITITVQNPPAAPTVVSPVAYCQGATAVPVSATASAGNTLVWYNSPTSTTPIVGPPTPGTTFASITDYYVSQKTSGGCESPRVNIHVVVSVTPAQPTASSAEYCKNATATPLTGTPSAGNTLNWYTGTGVLIGATAPTPSTATVGVTTYQVSQINTGSGCEGKRDTITVTIDPLPVVPVVTTPVTYCLNAVASPLTGTALAGNTLNWYTSTGTLIGATAPTPSTATAGTTTYQVSQVITATGCEGPKATITVVVNPLPTTNAGADQTVCTGSTAMLTATGATSYTWATLPVTTSQGTTASISVTPAATTTYVVTGTTGTCTKNDTVIVNVVGTPTVSVTPAAPSVCQNGSVILTASGAATYSWTLLGGGSAAGTLSATTGSPVTATLGTASVTYVVTGLAGTCSDTAHVTVTVNPPPAAPAVTTPVTYCLNAANATPLTATALAGNTLKWYQGTGATPTYLGTTAPTPSTAVAGTTTYQVSQVIAATGCEGAKATINVIVNPLPTTNAGADQTVCTGSTATLTATGATSYSWATLPVTTPQGTTASITVTPTATTTYVVTGTTNTCTKNDTVVVNVVGTPTVSVTPAAPSVCQNGSVILTASGASTYTWTLLGGGSAAGTLSATTGSPVTATLATASITYVVTGLAGTCSDTAHVTVVVNPPPAAPAVTTPVTYCLNAANATSLTATALAGNTLKWYQGTGATPTYIGTTAPTPSTAVAGTTTYQVSQVIAATGCEGAKATINVIVNPLPTTNAGADQTICTGSTATLTATGAAAYSWATLPVTTPQGTTASITVTPTATTTYVVTGTTNNCTVNDTVIVNVVGTPTVSVTPSAPVICNGGNVILTASGAATYTWTLLGGGSAAGTLSATTGSPVTATPTTTTTYVVTGAAGTCTATANVTVTVNPLPPVPTITTPVNYCQNATANPLTAATTQPTYILNWYTGAGVVIGTTAPTPSTATAGTVTYQVSQTNPATGCEGPKATISVIVAPLPTTNAGADQTVCTGSSATLTATGATSYSWATLPVTTSQGTTASITVTPAATTTYVVTGTTGNCTLNDTVTVNVVGNPTVSVTPSAPVICNGGNVVLTASGAATYTWALLGGGSAAGTLSATTGSPVTATPTATTTYVVTGAAGTCTATANVTVTVNQPPAAPAVTTPVNYCQNATAAVLTATAATGDTLKWYTGTTSLTAAPIPSTATAGTTPYLVSQVNTTTGCESPKATINVIVAPLPATNAGADPTICAGSSTTLTATGATSYSWVTLPATTPQGTTASITVTPAATTTYVVTGTTGACTTNDTVTVNISSNPVVTITPATQSICSGTSATMTASGASNYSWVLQGTSTPVLSSTSTLTVSPTATGTYSYVVTGGSGSCSATATGTVTVISKPNVSITGNNSLCLGSSVTLTAAATPAIALTYTWDTTGIANPVVVTNPITVAPTVLGAHLYTVIGDNGQGCSDTATFTVTVHPLPNVTVTSNKLNVCPGDVVTLTATGAGANPTTPYTWNIPVTCAGTNCATPTANIYDNPTNVIVTGHDNFGCADTGMVTINVYTPPTVTVTSPVTAICKNDTAILTANGAITYQWLSPTNGLNTFTGAVVHASPALTTTYQVQGTDGNGCKDTGTYALTVNPLPVITVSGQQSICFGSVTTLQASGGTGYVWHPGATLDDSTIAGPTAHPLATTTYTVVGTNANSCVSSTTYTVTVHALPVVNAGADTTICQGTLATLHATAVPAAISNFVWSPSVTCVSSNCGTATAQPAANTTYTVIGFDSFGCSDTDAVVVNVIPRPTVDAGLDTFVCKGNSVTLTATGGNSYAWSPGGTTPTSASTTVTPLVSPTTYTVIGTAPNGCHDTDQVQVSFYNQVPVSAGPDLTLCIGQTITLSATGGTGDNYVWTPAVNCVPATNCAQATAAPIQSTTYTVVGTDLHGCVDSDNVLVTVVPRNTTSVNASGDICAGQSYALTATGGDSYTWSPSASLNCNTCPNPVATPQQTTTYTVIIGQGQCFADTATVTVNVHPIPTVELGPDIRLISGNSVTIIPTVSNVDTFRWSPPDGLSCTACDTTTATPANTTTYTLYVSTIWGCTAQDDITVQVVCDGSQIWLPNTFTPNGDGQNDRFYAHGKGVTNIEHFRIYDRWGEVVYDAQDINIDDINYSWDGTYKGSPLKPDVYIYVISARCGTGAPIEMKGNVSLIR